MTSLETKADQVNIGAYQEQDSGSAKAERNGDSEGIRDITTTTHVDNTTTIPTANNVSSAEHKEKEEEKPPSILLNGKVDAPNIDTKQASTDNSTNNNTNNGASHDEEDIDSITANNTSLNGNPIVLTKGKEDTSPRRKKYRKRTKSKRSFATLSSFTTNELGASSPSIPPPPPPPPKSFTSPSSPTSPQSPNQSPASPASRGPPRRTLSSPALPLKSPPPSSLNSSFGISNNKTNNSKNKNSNKNSNKNFNNNINNNNDSNNSSSSPGSPSNIVSPRSPSSIVSPRRGNNNNNNNSSSSNFNNDTSISNNNNNNSSSSSSSSSSNNNNNANIPLAMLGALDEGPRPEGRVRSNAFYGRPTFNDPPRPKSLNGPIPTYSEIVSKGIASTTTTSTSSTKQPPQHASSAPVLIISSNDDVPDIPLPQQSISGACRPSKLWKKKTEQSHCIKNNSRRFLIGFAETIGRRPTMEDCMVIDGAFRGNNNEDYFAVFDGHGGRDAASFAAEHLHVILAEKLKTQNPVKSLREAFVETNQLISTQKIAGGTTACVALFIGKKGYVANVGDTRAVLCRDGITHRVSLDHKPELPQETSRIKSLGGTVTTTTNSSGHSTSRVNGMLAVSRALGDTNLHPYVSSEPEIHGPLNISTTDKSQFMVLACDGVWDVISDEEAVSIVAPIQDIDLASRRLRDEAYRRGSTDNISVMVIRFPPFHS